MRLRCFFSSLDGGTALKEQVLEAIDIARSISARSKCVEIHVMAFAFTDPEIAKHLELTARHATNLTVRILADWEQGSFGGGKKIPQLARLQFPNLQVRYTLDQPYVWDANADRIRWSYATSRGLLHHKTLSVVVQQKPILLLIGSFNWTSHALAGYENLVKINAGEFLANELMRRVEREFRAIWRDGKISLSPDEARHHYREIATAIRTSPYAEPDQVHGIGSGAGEHQTQWKEIPVTSELQEQDPIVRIGFNAPPAYPNAPSRRGCDTANAEQRFKLHKTSGKHRHVPLSTTTLALDLIARAQPADRLQIAMFAISRRSAEYNALLQAARRGVRLRMILDSRVGKPMKEHLDQLTSIEALDVEIRTSGRFMHQKYILHQKTDSVLFGTANMTPDAVHRHFENRIQLTGLPEFTERFSQDFALIWNRLSR